MPSLLILKALPWKLIGWAAIAFAFIACLAALRMEQAQNDKLKAQLHECTTLRQSDRDSYAKAQADAAKTNREQVAKVEQQQKEITHEIATDYARQLADLRNRLRSQAAPAAPGATGTTGSSAIRDPAAGADGQAGVPLPPAELLRAAENELQLDQLISWVERQTKVDPNK